MSVELFGVHVKHQSNAFFKTLITTAYNNDESGRERRRFFGWIKLKLNLFECFCIWEDFVYVEFANDTI